MKKRAYLWYVSFVILMIVLSGLILNQYQKAQVYAENPIHSYNGEYLIAYNTSTQIKNSQSVGILPSTPASNRKSDLLSKGDIPAHTKGTIEISGETSYIYEPQIGENMPREVDEKLTDMLADRIKKSKSIRATDDLKDFYAVHFDSGSGDSVYTLQANHMYDGLYCDIYLQQGTEYNDRITEEMIDSLGHEFDEYIRDKLVDHFGDYISGSTIEKPYLRNGKITLLLEDILDNDKNGIILGYFDSEDITGKVNSNQLSMVHLNMNPSLFSGIQTDPGSAEIINTLAHEFFHLVSYSDYEFSLSQSQSNELWWDEAFAMSIEEMLYQKTAADRITEFNMDSGDVIKNGAILNYQSYADNNYSISAGYGMAFLFGQYLRTQTTSLPNGGDTIFKQVLNSDYNDYRAIMEGLGSVGYPVTDFAELNRNFRIAMTLKEPTGYYGFMGESVYNSIQIPLHTGTYANLRGGAAIIKKIEDTFIPDGAGSDISFAGFSAGGIIDNGIETTPVPKTPIPKTPDPIIPVQSIRLNTNRVTLKINQSYTLLVGVLPNSATNKNITWESENRKLAVVNKNGKVTGKKAGTVSIIAKSANGKIAKCKVTIMNKLKKFTTYYGTYNSVKKMYSGYTGISKVTVRFYIKGKLLKKKITDNKGYFSIKNINPTFGILK